MSAPWSEREPMPRLTIADAALAVLVDARALAAEELGRLLAAQGVTKAQRPGTAVTRALESDGRFRQLGDGRWVSPAALLEGVTLLHRLTAAEAEGGVLPVEPDLAPLAWLDHEDLGLVDGRRLGCRHGDAARSLATDACDAVLVGPPGWLAHGAGSLLHVRVEAGRLSVAPGPGAVAASRLAQRRITESIRARLTTPPTPLLPTAVSIGMVILELLADDPGLLAAPVAPVGQALADAGLEVHRDWVGTPGTDWTEWDAWFEDDDDADDVDDVDDVVASFDDDADDDAIAEALGLDRYELDGLGIVLGAKDLYDRLGGFAEPGALGRMSQVVAIPAITRILAIRAWQDPTLERFIADAMGTVDGREGVGVMTVLAACAEARGAVLDAERLLREAVVADPGFEPALIALARYEEDRGDRAAALRLLRTAGVSPADRQLGFLEALAAPAVAKVGRNDPCPCGSGRKYKVCHLGQEQLVALDVAGSLLRKLWVWLDQPPNGQLAADVVVEAGLEGTEDDDDVPLPEAVDILIRDILLFDRAGLERFLDTRGVLLPAPELSLGRTWNDSRRALYEVQAVDRGRGVTLRDMASGALSELPDRTISRRAQPLDVVCLRLLPDGVGGLLTIDGFMVPRLQRQRVAETVASGNGLALLRWLADPTPSVQMRTSEGELIRFVTATYRVPDLVSAARALGRKLTTEGDGRFVETTRREGTDWVRGTITLAGEQAIIEANAVERADRLVKTLMRAAPDAVLIRREERSMDEVRQEAAASGTPPRAPIDPSEHPELAAALDSFIRDHEIRWVDQPIPMLGGLTPRQALVEPASRAELEALLDDMAWDQRQTDRPGVMDAARVRTLLGLPPGRLG